MEKSACELLLYRTYTESWQRGEVYANQRKVTVHKFDDTSIQASVRGSELYKTTLKFQSGGISRDCSCPVSDFCKHMVAVAIMWDELRGIPRPGKKDVEDSVIPPPLVSYSEVMRVYDQPLTANLEPLRLASSELGNWSRPHARLPKMPVFSSDEQKPLSVDEFKQACREIRRWSNQRNYDPYFCAGEMVAAFCEILRIVRKRLKVTSTVEAARVLLEAQKFDQKLILELIDDSEGEWQITKSHLDRLFQEVSRMKMLGHEKKEVAELLEDVREVQSDY